MAAEKFKFLIAQKIKETQVDFLRRLLKLQDNAKLKLRACKKLSQMVEQKEELNKFDALRQSQLLLKYRKIQRLNINIMFNSLGRI